MTDFQHSLPKCKCIGFMSTDVVDSGFCPLHAPTTMLTEPLQRMDMVDSTSMTRDEEIVYELDNIALSKATSINGVMVQMWDRKVLTAYVEQKLYQELQKARQDRLATSTALVDALEELRPTEVQKVFGDLKGTAKEHRKIDHFVTEAQNIIRTLLESKN